MNKDQVNIVKVAIALPIRKLFDYSLPENFDISVLEIGMRIKVPFGSRVLVGFVHSFISKIGYSVKKLKPITEIIDKKPFLSKVDMKLCQWVSDYYHYSLGEVLALTIPKYLKQGNSFPILRKKIWTIDIQCNEIESIKKKLLRSKKQLELFEWIFKKKNEQFREDKYLRSIGYSSFLVKLVEKKLIKPFYISNTEEEHQNQQSILKNDPLVLNKEQKTAVKLISVSNGFNTFLLNGITGSGKTEVYLQLAAAVLGKKKQVLVLVPEIGLTKQIVERFKKRFNVPIICLHSGLTESERLNNWMLAFKKSVSIIITTRSGVFFPISNLGLIILDEEHDLSYKQQDKLRYHARDVAIYKAKLLDCPIVLGSATPSLESFYNVSLGRYKYIELKSRAGSALSPSTSLVDLRKQSNIRGFAYSVIKEIRAHLEMGSQVLVFLNRRGFSSSLMCQECGWQCFCPSCDVPLTIHLTPPRMICHHCYYSQTVFKECPNCFKSQLKLSGQGTEKCEQTLEYLFPNTDILRIDKDSVRKKQAFDKILTKINKGNPSLLIGTQMLTKGHHFPNLTLVVIMNADNGLFSPDFRSIEKTSQTILQVSGRSGREEKDGKVLIQTSQMEHQIWSKILDQEYIEFLRFELQKRIQLSLPPVSFVAVLVGESEKLEKVHNALLLIKNNILLRIDLNKVKVIGPMPTLIEKMKGRYRQQLIYQSSTRSYLHSAIENSILFLEEQKLNRLMKWYIDVDPQESI